MVDTHKYSTDQLEIAKVSEHDVMTPARDPKQPGSVLSSGSGNLGGGIVWEESCGRNHGGGNIGKEAWVEESWGRSHGRRNHGGGIMGEES